MIRPPVAARSLPAFSLLAAIAAATAGGARAQTRFGEVGPRHLPQVRTLTSVMKLADVDGDGDLDLLSAGRFNYGGLPKNRLYLNDGGGVFRDGSARVGNSFTQTLSLGVCDVDGDGDLDLVKGSEFSLSGATSLVLNDGTGTFVGAPLGQMPQGSGSAQGVACGDVDGDGDVDVVWAMSAAFGGPAQNLIYINDGAGQFTDETATRMPAVMAETSSVALADVDGDGDVDLVCGNIGQGPGSQNNLYVNSGAGVFALAPPSSLPGAFGDTQDVAVGDVDGDGDLDIVFGNDRGTAPGNRLYLNQGAGTFVSAPQFPADGDATYSVVLDDFDGDGDLDLVCANGLGASRLYTNNGGGAFGSSTPLELTADLGTRAATAGDVDGDGDVDLLVGTFSRFPDRLLLNDGGGQFVDGMASQGLADSMGVEAVGLGDLDGDGDVDLVAIRAYGGVSAHRAYLNNGGGEFRDDGVPRLPTVPENAQALALGDIDADGDLDVIIGNRGLTVPERDRVFVNDGTGQFTDESGLRLPADLLATNALALGDVNGDGFVDLVCGVGASTGAVVGSLVYLNNGAGVFLPGTALPVSRDCRALALGDMDGDGDLDIVVAQGESVSAPNVWYANDGTGAFTLRSLSSVAVPTQSVALGDVDGDGDLDVVFGNGGLFVGARNQLLLNDGLGQFTDAAASLPAAAHLTYGIAFGDVDDDGDLDIVCADSSRYGGPQRNRLYVNGGTGLFQDAPIDLLPGGNAARALAMGDTDGDGDPDLVFGNWRTGAQHFTNLYRQMDSATRWRVGLPWTLDFYAFQAGAATAAVAFPFFSAVSVSIPVPPIGVLRTLPDVQLPFVPVDPATGKGSLTWTVPRTPTLVGLRVYGQAVIVAREIRLSNVTIQVGF